jgi:hypothetical protein
MLERWPVFKITVNLKKNKASKPLPGKDSNDIKIEYKKE